MEGTIDALILKLGTELKRVRKHEEHNQRGAKGIHEKLVTLRAAKWMAKSSEAPVTELHKPDEQHGGGMDLVFDCGGTRYLLEHTTIESFPEQRRWTETGKRSVPLPAWEDLPECRKDVIRAAFQS